MNYKEFILDLYKKGFTPKYIANLMLKKHINKGWFCTQMQALHFVECTILEYYTTQRT